MAFFYIGIFVRRGFFLLQDTMFDYHDRQISKLGFSSLLGINTLYSRHRAFSVGAIGPGRGISNWTNHFSISQSSREEGLEM